MTDLMTMSTVGKDIQTDDPPHKKITCYKAHNVFITDTESNSFQDLNGLIKLLKNIHSRT